jgi:hypothetical protein
VLSDDQTHRWSKPPKRGVFLQSVSVEVCGEAVDGIDAIETVKSPNCGVGNKTS